MFQASKYSVTLSNRTFHYLMRYLQQDKQPPVLLQIIHGKVDLRLSDSLSACSKVEAVERLKYEDVNGAGVQGLDGDDPHVVKSDFLTSRNVHTTTNHMLKKTEDTQKLQVKIRRRKSSHTGVPQSVILIWWSTHFIFS